MGHRTQLGLAFNPYNGEIWAGEQGPNGGDEVNVIKAGKNYGWPVVSYGRDYRGPRCRRRRARKAWNDPHVVWVPSIATVGHGVLHRRPLPELEAQPVRRRHARRRDRRAPASLQRIVFNDNWEEMRRESLLRDLHQRIRDVRQGPDGLLYVLTEEDQAALLRIEPAR